MSSRGKLLWGAYAIFVAIAMYFNWHDTLFDFDVRFGIFKFVLWLMLFCFMAYSIYCSMREDLFQSLGNMFQTFWGRQVGADLYIGVLLSLFVIYLHQGMTVALLWALAAIPFANLAIFLYFAIHFDSIVANFIV